jgi:hypothetical protein
MGAECRAYRRLQENDSLDAEQRIEHRNQRGNRNE